jgi:hypothetical protein
MGAALAQRRSDFADPPCFPRRSRTAPIASTSSRRHQPRAIWPAAEGCRGAHPILPRRLSSPALLMDTVLDTRVVTRMDTRVVTVSIRSIHAPCDPSARDCSVFRPRSRRSRPRQMLVLVVVFDLLPFPTHVGTPAGVGSPTDDDPRLLPRARRPEGRLGARSSPWSHEPRPVSCPEASAEGNDRSRGALGPRSTAGRLRIRVVSCSCPPAAITNTLAGYRTAEPSDSPRASRYASRWPPFPTAQATARGANGRR